MFSTLLQRSFQGNSRPRNKALIVSAMHDTALFVFLLPRQKRQTNMVQLLAAQHRPTPQQQQLSTFWVSDLIGTGYKEERTKPAPSVRCTMYNDERPARKIELD